MRCVADHFVASGRPTGIHHVTSGVARGVPGAQAIGRGPSGRPAGTPRLGRLELGSRRQGRVYGGPHRPGPPPGRAKRPFVTFSAGQGVSDGSSIARIGAHIDQHPSGAP